MPIITLMGQQQSPWKWYTYCSDYGCFQTLYIMLWEKKKHCDRWGRRKVICFSVLRNTVRSKYTLFWFRLSRRPSVKRYTHCGPHWRSFHGNSHPPGNLPESSCLAVCSIGRDRLYLVTVNDNSNLYGENGLYFSILNPSGQSTCCDYVSLFSLFSSRVSPAFDLVVFVRSSVMKLNCRLCENHNLAQRHVIQQSLSWIRWFSHRSIFLQL